MVRIQCRDVIFNNIQAVIFDKDGTLENTADFLRNLGIKRSRLIDAQIPGIGEPLLMAFGIDADRIDPTGLMAVGSRRENEIAAAAYIAETGRGWLESLEIAHRAFADADEYLKKSTHAPIFNGCLEVIKYLFDAGLKLGILSAAPTQEVADFAQRYQLQDYMSLFMGVDDGPSKPDPRLFWQACHSLAVEPGAALMVGDSLGDIMMAKNAGAAGCVGICWGQNGVGYLKGADVAIASLDEIRILVN